MLTLDLDYQKIIENNEQLKKIDESGWNVLKIDQKSRKNVEKWMKIDQKFDENLGKFNENKN